MKHQQIAIAHAGVEGRLVRPEMTLQIGHQRPGLDLIEMARRIVEQNAVRRHRNQIAAPGDVIRPEFDSLAHGFNGTAAGIILFGIKAQHRHIGHVGGGGQPVRQGEKSAAGAFAGDGVHGGRFRKFQRRLAAEFGNRQIGHAVGQKNHSFTHLQTLDRLRQYNFVNHSAGGFRRYRRQLDGLAAAGEAGDDFHRRLRHMKKVGQESDQRGIGGAIHRRRGQSDFQRAVMPLHHRIARGARLDVTAQPATAAAGNKPVTGAGCRGHRRLLSRHRRRSFRSGRDFRRDGFLHDGFARRRIFRRTGIDGGLAPEQDIDFDGTQGFAFQQRLRQLFQLIAMGSQQFAGPVERRINQISDLDVDFPRSRLAGIMHRRRIEPDMHMFAEVTVFDRADLVVHPVDADHHPRQAADHFDILRGAGGDVADHLLLGHAAAQTHGHLVEQFQLAFGIDIFLRHRERRAEIGLAARNDRHLMQRLGVFAIQPHQRVPRFVIRRQAAFAVGDPAAAPFPAEADLVARLLHVALENAVAVFARRQQRRLIAQIGQIGAAESRRRLRHHVEIDFGVEPDIFAVHRENLPPPADIGQIKHHLAVEPARPEQRRIEHVGPVGGRQHDHIGTIFQPVHFDQHGVQSLFALVVAAAQSREAGAPYGVDFIDENQAGAVAAGMIEHVAHPAGTDPDEHFHEVRTRNREKRHLGLACHRLGQHRFARSRRPDQQAAARNLAAEQLEFERVLEVFDDFLNFFLGLVGSGHVAEAHIELIGRNHPRPRLAELHGIAVGHLDLPRKQDVNHRRDDQHRQDQRDQPGEPVILLDDRNLGPLQRLIEAGAFDDPGFELAQRRGVFTLQPGRLKLLGRQLVFAFDIEHRIGFRRHLGRGHFARVQPLLETALVPLGHLARAGFVPPEEQHEAAQNQQPEDQRHRRLAARQPSVAEAGNRRFFRPLGRLLVIRIHKKNVLPKNDRSHSYKKPSASTIRSIRTKRGRFFQKLHPNRDLRRPDTAPGAAMRPFKPTDW
ncbi:hypothetical protein SDC9_79881 [bioreactor metagenome]|uniref:Uncharacterized protein n=1 Tax=bioreactor metagenome TaxID=1076179 RepID=A0A644YZ42_9ZZZZ